MLLSIHFLCLSHTPFPLLNFHQILGGGLLWYGNLEGQTRKTSGKMKQANNWQIKQHALNWQTRNITNKNYWNDALALVVNRSCGLGKVQCRGATKLSQAKSFLAQLHMCRAWAQQVSRISAWTWDKNGSLSLAQKNKCKHLNI